MKKPIPLVLVLAAVIAFVAPAAASASDRNHNTVPDRWEHQHGLSLAHDSANGDPDRDGVDNRNEYRERTEPRKRDTDHDGRPDGREDADHDGLSNAAEDATGNDPIDPDSDDDGVRDGREGAGTVVSFTDGLLVLRLESGATTQGTVDDLTDLECGSEGRFERHQHGHGKARHRRGLRVTHRKHRHRRGGSAHRSARASSDDPSADAGDDSGDDGNADEGDDPTGDETGSGDDQSADDGDDAADDGDDWSDDDSGDDESGDDESFDDEGSSDDSVSSCATSRLRPGARVHASVLEQGDEGPVFLVVELVR